MSPPPSTGASPFPDYVVLDFETANGAVDLKEAGAWRYAESPCTEVICLSYSVNAGEPSIWRPGEGFPSDLSPSLNPGRTFIAHNAQFEKAIWQKIMRPLYDWPDIPNSRWHCTLAVCAARSLPQGLADAGFVLRLPSQKDDEGSRITTGLSRPNKKGVYDRGEETLRRVGEYCMQDVRAETALHNRIGGLTNGERNTWLLDQRINERGIRLDREYIERAKAIVEAASKPLSDEFSSLTGGLKYTQRDKIIAWCESQGAFLPDLRKETVAEFIGQDIDAEEPDEIDPSGFHVPDNVRRALNIRQLVNSASVKKLHRMEACVSADGRARGLLQYHGTGPGRWAGRLLQPQNFPRPTLRIDDAPADRDAIVAGIMTGDAEHVRRVLGPPIETVVSGLRHSIICDAGRCLLSGDYAGIQARLVLSLAGQHDKTALMATGQDVYCDMAAAIYKRPIDKKHDPEERQTGKNSVLGLGFQMGWKKFKAKYAKEEEDEFCQHIVSTYRKEWAPKVPSVWYGLEDAAVKTVWDGLPQEAYGVSYALEDIWLTARLPSGRKIYYPFPKRVKKAMPWDENDVRLGFTFKAMKLGQWKEVSAFGGLLTENVIMGMEVDIMVGGMFRCEKAGLPIVLTVHDEILVEPLIKDADEKAFNQILCDVEPWVKQLQVPIQVDTWVGERYRK